MKLVIDNDKDTIAKILRFSEHLIVSPPTIVFHSTSRCPNRDTIYNYLSRKVYITYFKKKRSN